MAIDEVGLGSLLQQARKKAGLTQQQLCSKANLSYSTLAKIERGAIKSPSIFTIYNIANALDTNLNDLLGDALPDTSVQSAKKQSKSGVRFVYFDINGCLVRFFHRAFAKLAEDTGASADIIETTFWHYNDVACRGEMPMEEFNSLFAKKLGVDSLDWKNYYLGAVEPIKEMQQLLLWASKHYKVGLLSNIMPDFIESMIANGTLPKLEYAAIIDSSKTGAIKPEPKIYEAAMYYTGCEPHETMLIDDSRANLMAAEREGWKVLWFDDYNPSEGAERVKKALEF